MEEFNISEEVKRLVPFLGKEKAAKLEVAYYLGNENYRKKIIELIEGIKAIALSDKELREGILIEPPPKEIASKGEIEFGKILYGRKELYPLFIQTKDLLTHVGIFGSSGSGKTNLVHYLVKELAKQEIPVLIFDFSKRNYRDLLATELKERITIYTVGRNLVPFKFNPLVPPRGVQVSQWIKEFAEIFDHAYWLMGGGRHIILRALDELYAKFSPAYPKIFDVKNYLEKLSYAQLSPRERNWVATAKRPLESLCFRETGEIFDCEQGIKPSSFFERGKITVLELDVLASDDKTFLIEILLQWIRDWLLVSNTREKLVGVIVLEEAHHVLNREKSKKFGIECVTDLIFREIRELGIGMVYTDQHPSLVSYPALGNTSTHVYMNLGLDTKHSSDIQDASNMLGLKKEDSGYLRRLPVGHAFILIRRSEFPNPFLVKFPLLLKERGKIDDKILRKLMEEKVVKFVKSRKKEKVPEVEIEEEFKKVSSNGWRIIEALGNFKACTTSEIYKLLRISGRVFKQEVKKLADLNLVAWKRAKVYRQKAIFYFLTRKGELAFMFKFRRIPEEKVEMEKRKILNRLERMGYKVKEVKDERVCCEKNGKEVLIFLEDSSERNKILNHVRESLQNLEGYFVCASEKIKNCLLQACARESFLSRANFTVFILGEKGFERVEFLA